MLYKQIIAICSEIHKKHITTLFGHNVEFVNFKLGGAYIDQCAVHIVTTGLYRYKIWSYHPICNVRRTIWIHKHFQLFSNVAS